MSPDYDEMDKLASYLNSPLDDFFLVTDKMNGSAIKVNDKDYQFNIDPEHIERVEKSKFYGREDEFPFDHVADLHELSEAIGIGEINQRYHFLKLFPFSLGGSAKSWYNCLEPGCITSKEECLRMFFDKYFPASKRRHTR